NVGLHQTLDQTLN
nr:tropomyosin=33 kda calcium binding protein fragment e [human, platelet, Peptide Partial, 13 aa] [Homo sapiens]